MSSIASGPDVDGFYLAKPNAPSRDRDTVYSRTAEGQIGRQVVLTLIFVSQYIIQMFMQCALKTHICIFSDYSSEYRSKIEEKILLLHVALF